MIKIKVRGETLLSKEQKDAIANKSKEPTWEELDKLSREGNEQALSDALRISRYEPGVSIETIAEIIFTHLDQEETRSLIDKLVILQGKKYGERLFA
jgi:hypothetical protein